MTHARRLTFLSFVVGIQLLLGGCRAERINYDAGSATVDLTAWDYAVAPSALSLPKDVPADAWRALGPDLQLPNEAAAKGTVWFRTKLPLHAFDDPTVMLGSVRSTFQAFLDTQLVYTFAPKKRTQRPSYQGEPTQLLRLPKGYEGKTLYLQVSSSSGRIGITPPAVLGPRGNMILNIAVTGMAYLLLGCVSFFIGLATLLIYLFIARSPVLASFGGFAAGFGVYSILHTSAAYLFLPWPLICDYIQYAVTYATPFAFITFSSHAIGGFRYRFLAYARWFFPVLSVATIALALRHIVDLPQTLALFQSAVAVCGLLMLVEIAFKVAAGDANAKLCGIGIALVCGAAILDVLADRQILDASVSGSQWAMLVFLFLLATVVVRSVRDETGRRLFLQNELETASILQTQFLQTNQVEREPFLLQAYCKPASHLGGDWYSYRVVDARWLQVHLADVTGHGTRAALVAAYAMGALDLYYQNFISRTGEEPRLDDLHVLMNQTLCQVGNRRATMTMISVSIDLQTGETKILNSGNPWPLTFTDAETFTVHRGSNFYPLGFETAFASKQPAVSQLRRGDTFVLFSDGVSEIFVKNSVATRHAAKSIAAAKVVHGPKELCDYIARVTAVTESQRGLDDDVTLIAIKLAGA